MYMVAFMPLLKNLCSSLNTRVSVSAAIAKRSHSANALFLRIAGMGTSIGCESQGCCKPNGNGRMQGDQLRDDKHVVLFGAPGDQTGCADSTVVERLERRAVITIEGRSSPHRGNPPRRVEMYLEIGYHLSTSLHRQLSNQTHNQIPS